MNSDVYFKCPFTNEPCFAKTLNGKCKLLNKAPVGKCSFKKPYREYTDGKYYPTLKYNDPKHILVTRYGNVEYSKKEAR